MVAQVEAGRLWPGFRHLLEVVLGRRNDGNLGRDGETHVFEVVHVQQRLDRVN